MASIVRLVTLAGTGTPSVNAFADELTTVFGLGKKKQLDYKAYSAVVEGSLSTAAKKAVNDNPQVIVAGGVAAVAAVLTALKGVLTPIVMVGGAAPSDPPPPNLTGFLINQKKIAQDHVKKLLAVATKIAILHDNTSGTLSLATYTAITTGIPSAKLVSLPAKSDVHIRRSKLGGADGFMLIPNATYYQHSKDIAGLVDGNVNTIYYPEREYKRWHSKSTKGVYVHGHSIPLAFRRAAWYADSIASGDWASRLPPLTEAPTDDT